MHYFEIAIAGKAERLSLQQLTDLERVAILRGIEPDETKHCLFRILISPVFDASKTYNNRQTRRLRLDRAAQFCVQVKAPEGLLELCGIAPVSANENGSIPPESEIEALFEIGISKHIKFSLKKKYKKILNNNEPLLRANYVTKLAQWIFYKPYIRDHAHYNVQLLCVIPADVPALERFLDCEVVARDGSRTIGNKTYRQRVQL